MEETDAVHTASRVYSQNVTARPAVCTAGRADGQMATYENTFNSPLLTLTLTLNP